MVQLQILSGKMAGTQWVARRFPVRVGRAKTCHLCLEEDGVWDDHLSIRLGDAGGFLLSVHSGAMASINSQPVQQADLRNGDSIELGSARLRFWLSPPHQSGLRFREWLTWGMLAGAAAGQILLIYWLLRQ